MKKSCIAMLQECGNANRSFHCIPPFQTIGCCMGARSAPDLSFLPLRGSGAELSPSDYGAAHNAREKNLHKI